MEIIQYNQERFTETQYEFIVCYSLKGIHLSQQKFHCIELCKEMFKIPLKMVNMKAFPDHGWRFANLSAFYITIDDKLGKNSLIYNLYDISQIIIRYLVKMKGHP